VSPVVNRNQGVVPLGKGRKDMTTAQQDERFRRLAEKQRAVDTKLSRWFGIPALATQLATAQLATATEEWGEIEVGILEFSESRPASLRRMLQSHGRRLYRAVGGDNDPDFIAATLVSEGSSVRLPSLRFASASAASLTGYGPGERPVREGLVRFTHGGVTVDTVGFPTDERWGLYCLSSEKDPAESEYREVFAIRWGALPGATADPFDLVETGHLAAARQRAEEGGWAGPKLDSLRIMAAVRMEILIEQAAADIRASGWLTAEQQYLLDQFVESWGQMVAGTVQAIGKRIRANKNP
jgi:hypothetical protein